LGGGPPSTLFADNQVVHGGLWSARIERTATSPNQFSTMTRMLPVDFTGAKIELRGFLRTKDVSGYAGMWLREDGDVGISQGPRRLSTADDVSHRQSP
jgi:hypothetical protein